MKTKFPALGGLLALCLVSPLGGLTLDVETSVQLASRQNLSLKTEDSKVAGKKRDKDLSWNRFLPTASVTAGLARTNQVSATQGLAVVPSSQLAPGVYNWVSPYSFTPDAWNLTVNFNAQLVLSPAIFTGINQTLIDYDNAVLSRQTAEKKLERDVRKAFYQLLALKQALDLTEKQVANAEKRYQQAQNSFKSGLASKLQALQAQVAWETKKPALDDLRLNYRQAQLGFKLLLGLGLDEELVLNGTIPEAKLAAGVTASGLISGRLDQRLDVLGLAGTIKSLRNVAALNDDLALPQLIVSWTADPVVNKPFDSKSYEETTTTKPWLQRSGTLAFLVRLGLDNLLPFTPAGLASAPYRDLADQAAYGLEQTRQAGALEITMLVERLRKSEASMTALQLSQSLAEEAWLQTEAAYKSGNASLIEVQEAEVQFQGAQLQVLNERLGAVLERLDLEYAINGSL